MASAAAFIADTSADSLQLSARAMAAGVPVRRSTWDVDAALHAKVVALPFHGTKLFGEDLEPLLVETKGKH